jgi:hypothetical protein
MADTQTSPRPRSLARTAAALAAAVIAAGALLLLGFYLLHKEKPIAGTPAPRALFKTAVFTIHPQERACLSPVTLPRRGDLMQLEVREVQTGAHGIPPVEAILNAPGYHATASLPAEEPEGVVGLPVQPPPHDVIGSICLVNRGTSPVGLAGSTEARSVSRVQLTLNGRPTAGDIALTFLKNRPQSRLSRIAEVFEHASNLTDRLIPAWLIWLLAVVALCAVPVGTVAFIHRALREDEGA